MNIELYYIFSVFVWNFVEYELNIEFVLGWENSLLADLKNINVDQTTFSVSVSGFSVHPTASNRNCNKLF